MIVLQEQSLSAQYSSRVKDTYNSIKKLSIIAKKQNAAILFFKTWARHKNNGLYQDATYKNILKNPEHMYLQIDKQTREIAQIPNVFIIPIGDYWHFITQQYPDIKLYLSDGSHPTPSGSYLSALIFYKYITRDTPINTTFRPNHITKKKAETLRKIAAFKLK